MRLSLIAAAAAERLRYDLGPLRRPAAEAAYRAAGLTRDPAAAFLRLMRLHGAAWSAAVDARILSRIAAATAAERRGQPTGLWEAYRRVVRDAARAAIGTPKADPRRLIGSNLFVVKSARPRERGVLALSYSHLFPLLPAAFDVEAILRRYFLVLEPSWSGVCCPEILQFGRFDAGVLVETIEPRDAGVLSALGSHPRPVPIAANWWVDHRLIKPDANRRRDIDVIMIAAWAGLKRHWRLFKALAALRRRGHRLSVALVGYPYGPGETRDGILDAARYFGVADQIECFEHVPAAKVAELLARSKIHVLWSRRECANRALIEAMLADVPVIVREGLTYGHKYPYINEHTGEMIRERDLGDAMLRLIETRDRYAPREWVLQHMTPQHATTALEASLAAAASELGEAWTEGLAVKTYQQFTQRYWSPADRERFARDHAFLETAISV